MYVSNSLRAAQVTIDGSQFEEQLWVQIPLRGADLLLVGCIYRSPSGDGALTADGLCELLSLATARSPSHLLIAGDVNLPEVDWSVGFSSAPDGHYSHKVIDTIHDTFLYQHVTEPTRYRMGETPHILDVVLTNEEGMVRSLSYGPGIGMSDHLVLTFDLLCYTLPPPPQLPFPNFHRADFRRLNNLLAETEWGFSSVSSVQDDYNSFLHTLSLLSDQCIPRSRTKGRTKNIYMNQTALRLRKKKRALWHEYAQTRDVIAHARYIRSRNDLRRLTRDLRTQFESRLVRDIKDNPKAFWRYTNTRLKVKSRIEDLSDGTGATASTDQEKAEVLNAYFSSVFTVEDCSNPFPDNPYTGPAISDLSIDAAAVRNKVLSLKPCSSPGPDGLHPRLLKETAFSLAGPLASMFRKSLDSGVIPDEWKTGEVTPIFKKGSKKTPANYRPVSLTSVPCKILESLVRDQLLEHLMSSRQLHESQHGFRPKRSCTSQLLVTIDHWTKTLEAGEPVDTLYLDFRKAFDSVPHRRLLRKVEACGVTGKLLRWVHAFLSGRRQRVVIQGSSSSWADVTSGVPQGSVLGPLLFLIYVNDLPEVVRSHVQLFADDTKLYRPVALPEDCRHLQQDLDALAAWSSTWQLAFNESKCHSLHLGRTNRKTAYQLGDTQLEQVTKERDLGVIVDPEMKFRHHAAAAVAKASQILAVIRRSFSLVDKTTLPLLFKTLVRPHLEYGNVVWGPFNRADQKLVERVQRRATRLVEEIRTLPYSERLRRLNLPSLYYRRRRGDMISVYQILHGGMDVRPDIFFAPAALRTTRGHPWKLEKPRAVSRSRRNAFSVRVVNDWNTLPLQVVASETLAQFKSQLDTHWRHLAYTTPDQD